MIQGQHSEKLLTDFSKAFVYLSHELKNEKLQLYDFSINS